MPSSVSREVEGVDTQPVDIVIDMFDASGIFYQDVAGIVVALGNAVLHQFPKRNREILVGKLSAGARYWAAFGMPFMETMLSRLMLCLSILSSTASAMEFEYTEQGEVYMVVIPEHVSLSVHTAIPTVAFLPLSRLSIRFSSSDICCARMTVAIHK